MWENNDSGLESVPFSVLEKEYKKRIEERERLLNKKSHLEQQLSEIERAVQSETLSEEPKIRAKVQRKKRTKTRYKFPKTPSKGRKAVAKDGKPAERWRRVIEKTIPGNRYTVAYLVTIARGVKGDGVTDSTLRSFLSRTCSNHPAFDRIEHGVYRRCNDPSAEKRLLDPNARKP